MDGNCRAAAGKQRKHLASMILRGDDKGVKDGGVAYEECVTVRR